MKYGVHKNSIFYYNFLKIDFLINIIDIKKIKMDMNMNIDIRDKVNSFLEEHYLVLINKQYGGFSLSEEAIIMILKEFPNIPDLKSREVHEYYPDFDFDFWHEKVRTNQDIVKFLLNFILDSEHIYTGMEIISGNHCCVDIAFIPMIDGVPIPYRIEEFDGVENIVPNIDKDHIIEELCSHIDRLNHNQDGAAAADNLSFYAKIALQYGSIPRFIRNKPITLKKIFIEEHKFVMNRMNQMNGFMPNIANIHIRNEDNDDVIDKDGVINGDNNDPDNNDAGESDN